METRMHPALTNTYGPTLDVLDLQSNDLDRLESSLDDLTSTPMEYSTSCPDYPQLSQKTGHYVFVYDGLKSGFARSKNLIGHPTLAVGYTKASLVLYKTDHVVPQGLALVVTDKVDSAPVYGEVYLVPPETIRELDWLYANTLQTRRLRVPIQAIVDSKGTSKQVYAFMWVNLMSYWHSRMDRLVKCDLLTANSNGQRYYSFMKKYEN